MSRLTHVHNRVVGQLATFLWLVLPLLLNTGETFGQHRQICITIDDVPCSNCANESTLLSVNRKLLETLTRNKVPAIGFVNEGKVYTNGKPDEAKVAVLQQWIARGLELGNHTYSHVSIDRVSPAAYENDLLKGEQITRPLLAQYGKELRYFRHPQLRTGPTVAYRKTLDSLLRKHRYQTAPVTMDNDEYIYAYCYAKADEQHDTTAMREIADDYLRYMTTIVAYYEQLSTKFLGYHVKQILLLHANQLNADYLPNLLQLFTQRGYRFISLAEALTDPAYSLPEAGSTKGISWLHRWMLAKNQTPTEQPALSEAILNQMKTYQSGR